MNLLILLLVFCPYLITGHLDRLNVSYTAMNSTSEVIKKSELTVTQIGMIVIGVGFIIGLALILFTMVDICRCCCFKNRRDYNEISSFDL